MRIEATALDTCDASAAFSAWSWSSCLSRLSTATFARSTATFTATTPARDRTDAWPRGCGRRDRLGREPVDRGHLLRLHRCTEPCRSGARIRRHLRLARADRAPLDRAQLRLVTADAHRKIRGARAAALALAQELLDDPVLERMEGDHRQASARPQHLERGRERDLERAEL